MTNFDFIIVGGGAAGYFTAINLAEKNKNLRILILEKTKKTLQKVKVSGGGRCNVTNHCFDVEKLLKNYPRGGDFLKEPFKEFGPKDTIDWFTNRNVPLKTESDNRVFPKSDSSSSIIDCFKNLAHKYGIEMLLEQRVESFSFENQFWQVGTDRGNHIAKNLVIATGSDSRVWEIIKQLDISTIPEVPSLFTFKINDSDLHKLSGISFKEADVWIEKSQLKNSGPLLITHWGLSGPAILVLSSFGAIELNAMDYKFELKVNFAPNFSKKEIETILKQKQGKNKVYNDPQFGFSQRFWQYLLNKANLSEFLNWSETGKKQIARLSELITSHSYKVDGKSTFKEEFVSAGGVDLKEINLKNFSSKKYPSLFFAGEVLNIDAITGGFNFQAAWTTSYLISKS